MIALQHLPILVLGIVFCGLVMYYEKRQQQTLKKILPFFCFYLILNLTVKTMIRGWNYYILRDSIPFIVFCLAHFLKIKTSFKWAYSSITVMIITGFFLLNSNYNAQLTKQIIGLPWAYWVFIEYLVFSILFFEILAKKIQNDFQAFSYTLLLLPVVGLTYKLPNNPVYFLSWSVWQPFFICSSFFMLFLVCYKIGLSTFIKPIVLLSLSLSLLFGVYYYYINPTMPSWTVRLPTLIFWVVATLSMKSNMHALRGDEPL